MDVIYIGSWLEILAIIHISFVFVYHRIYYLLFISYYQHLESVFQMPSQAELDQLLERGNAGQFDDVPEEEDEEDMEDQSSS